MFNRLKNLGNKNTRLQRNQDEIEQSGFICPICMKGLPSAELLQQHFDVDHPIGDAPDKSTSKPEQTPIQQQQPSSQQTFPVLALNDPSQNPTKQDLKNDVDTTHSVNDVKSMQSVNANHVDVNGVNEANIQSTLKNDTSLNEEVNDLRASLSEEKWYSAELKKELKVLEEKNVKLLEDSSVIQQQMQIAVDTNEELAKQKQVLEQKAISLAQRVADAKAAKDEMNDLRLSTLDKCSNQAIELEKAAEWVRDLQSQLLQRPGADDVMVLKKELVSVQTLMDQMTLDTEKKSKEQEEKSEREKEEVEQERRRLHEELEEAKKKERIVKEEFDAYKLENSRLKEQNKESEMAKDQSTLQHQVQQTQLLQQHDDQQNKIKEDLSNTQHFLSKEQDFSKSLQMEANKLEEEKIILQDEIRKLKESSTNLNKELELKQVDLQELESKDSTNKLTIANLKQNILDLNKTIERILIDHKQELINKENALENLSAQHDKLKHSNEENANIIEQVNTKHAELIEKYDELRKSNQDMGLESGVVRQELEMKITQMNIQLESMKADKEKVEGEKEKLTKEWEESRSRYEEQVALGRRAQLEFEREIMELKLCNTNYEETVKSVGQKLEGLEIDLKSNQDELKTMQDKYSKQSTEVALKVQELQTLKEANNLTNSKLEEEVNRREIANEEAKKLREERIILIEKMEAGEGDEAAREQIQDENRELRKQKEDLEEKLRSDASTHEEVNSSLSTQLNELKTQLKAEQDKLELSRQDVVKQKELLDNEKEKSSQFQTDLKVKGELLMTAQSAIMTQRSDMESHLNTVQASLSEKTKDLEKSNVENAENKTLLESMKAEMSSVKQDHVLELTKLKNNLENSQSVIKYSEEEVARWKKEFDDEKEKGKREIAKKREELCDLETKLNEKVSLFQLEISNLEDAIRMKDEKFMEVSNSYEKIKLELNELNENHLKLKKNHQSLNNDFELKESQLKEAENNVCCKEEEIKLLSTNQDKELTLWKEKEENMKVQFAISNAEMKGKHDRLLNDIQEMENNFSAEKLASEQNLEKLNKKYNETQTYQATLVQQIEEFTKSKADSDREISRFSLESTTNTKTISDLEEKLRYALVDIKLKDNQINNEKEMLEVSRNDFKRVESELTKTTEALNKKEQHFVSNCQELNALKLKSEQLQTSDNDLREKLNSSLNNLSEKERDFEIKVQNNLEVVSRLENNLKQKETDCAELNENLSDLKEKLTASENTISTQKQNMEENINSLRDQVDEFQKEKSISDEKIIEKEIEMTKIRNQLEEIKSARLSCERELEEKNESLKSMQEKMVKKDEAFDRMNEEFENEKQNTQKVFAENERKWKEEKKSLIDQVDSLESSQKILIGHKVELQDMADNLRENLDREKVDSKKLEEKWKVELQLKVDAISIMKNNMDQSGRELERCEAERVVSESRLQLEISSLSENLNSVRAEWIATSQSLDKLKEENGDLRGQIVVLQAAQQSDADERRALLQRCLNSEQQIDQQTSRIHELKKKFDNTQSAMHELGRENQALQVKHTNTISRQWADDRVANNCKACGRNFTLTVRRHHCRHCGEIFCSECSTRSAQVAASKNPVRVCEKCYDDLLVAS